MASEVEVSSGQRQRLSPDERAEVMTRIAELMARLEAMGDRLQGLASEVGGEKELAVTLLVQRHAA